MSSNQGQDQIAMMQVFAGAFMQAMNTINSQNQVQLPGPDQVQQGRIQAVEEPSQPRVSMISQNRRSLRSNAERVEQDGRMGVHTRRQARQLVAGMECTPHDESTTSMPATRTPGQQISNSESFLSPLLPGTQVQRITKNTQPTTSTMQSTPITAPNSDAALILPPVADDTSAAEAAFQSESIAQHTSDTDSELSSVPSSHRARSESEDIELETEPQSTTTQPQVSPTSISDSQLGASLSQSIPDLSSNQPMTSGISDNSCSEHHPQARLITATPQPQTPHIWRPIPIRPQQRFPLYDGLPSFPSSPSTPSRRSEKAPVIVISDDEDDGSSIHRRGGAYDDRSLNAQFYASHTRPSQQSRHQMTDQDAHWDLEDDVDATGSRKRACYEAQQNDGRGRRHDREGRRKQRHEREWEHRRRALLRDRQMQERETMEEQSSRQELTPPTDYSLGQAEMQEFEGLLGRRSSVVERTVNDTITESSRGAPLQQNMRNTQISSQDPNNSLIPIFMLELDKAQRAANKGRYDLEDAIAAFDKERSSCNTPVPSSSEPVIEILDDEETAKENADIQRRTQQYIDENEEFFAPTDEELEQGAIEGQKRIEECGENEKCEKERIWEEVSRDVEENRKSVDFMLPLASC